MRLLTENEKRILALIVRRGAMAKSELAAQGDMGWATAVKFVNRLESEKVLRRAGTASREVALGKNSYLYDLGECAPIFVGIDIEYRTARFALSDLRSEVLYEWSVPTPQVKGRDELKRFLSASIDQAFSAAESIGNREPIAIGIGMPNWLLSDGRAVFSWLASSLEEEFQIPVRVENNIRAYTLYKETSLLEENFLVVSVRNGVGAGIVLNGDLHRGEEGLSGEIGHITVTDGGKLCRCGRRGCLETEVNQRTLYESFAKRVAVSGHTARDSTSDLPELFRAAKEQDPDAVAVLTDMAEPFGRALATLILVLNVRNLYLVGHFGEHGAVWLPYLEEVIRHHVDSRLSFELNYRELDDSGYLLGAAMLVARDYLDYSVLTRSMDTSATR